MIKPHHNRWGSFFIFAFLILTFMNNKNTKEEEKLYTKFDKQLGDFFLRIFKEIGIAGTVIVLIILLIGFIWLISQEPIQCLTFDIAASHNVGDAMGGMLSPVIGLIAIVLTFCAFWVQYKFNQKQNEFYQNDKLDRKVDEYNKLIENFSDRKPIYFSDIQIPNTNNIYREAFKLMLNDIKKNKIKQTYLKATLVHYFKKALEEYYDKTDSVKDKEVSNDVVNFVLTFIEDVRALYRLLYYFLKEVNHFEVSRDKKKFMIESFIQKFSLLNNKSNASVMYLSLKIFGIKGISKKYTPQDIELMNEIIDSMSENYSEERLICMNYILDNLK